MTTYLTTVNNGVVGTKTVAAFDQQITAAGRTAPGVYMVAADATIAFNGGLITLRAGVPYPLDTAVVVAFENAGVAITLMTN